MQERRHGYGDLADKIDRIDKFITGDPTANPPLKGINERVNALEDVEKMRIKNKDTAINMATGSIAIAVGSVVIWLATVIKEAFIKH